ncbi:unannotated protein [freshwater metagenome]|uniref:Unannotated protein n=1 Tax=freshwater metagenome TaxID=449393 RepID=A0A6J7ERG0_9ZZZZ
MMSAPADASEALRDSAPRPFWTDRADAPQACAPLTAHTTCDLLIVGGGLTGLWSAIEAKAADPSADVVLLEAKEVAFGASGRNGGFFSESLTHGIAHGLALWPSEMPTLLRLGRENIAEIIAFLESEGIDAGLRMCGKTAVAIKPHQLDELRESTALHQEFGERAVMLDADAVQADVHSPTYLGGMRVLSGGGLLDPALLCWGLKRAAIARGVRIHEGTAVTGLVSDGDAISVRTPHARVRAARVLLATNAYPPLLRRLRSRVLPIYDHVLVTEPLSAAQLSDIGWSDSQGMTDSGNQFHYYRRTDDNRILWGGYDAVYYFGNQTDAGREQREQSHRLLAQQFFETFPQLAGLRFTHRWAGLIDSTSRFTPVFGTAMGGRLGYAVGFTGLGVGASRFGARTTLDLLANRSTERTALQLVQRKPFPFPPEPLRYPLVQVTRAALAREDVSGHRGIWLRTLDRFGIGFNS